MAVLRLLGEEGPVRSMLLLLWLRLFSERDDVFSSCCLSLAPSIAAATATGLSFSPEPVSSTICGMDCCQEELLLSPALLAELWLSFRATVARPGTILLRKEARPLEVRAVGLASPLPFSLPLGVMIMLLLRRRGREALPTALPAPVPVLVVLLVEASPILVDHGAGAEAAAVRQDTSLLLRVCSLEDVAQLSPLHHRSNASFSSIARGSKIGTSGTAIQVNTEVRTQLQLLT